VTKYVNELYGHVYARLFGLKIIGLRYFNVFGKRQSPNGAYAAAIPRFVKAFLNGDSPQIHGDGLQTRDFTYIANVVQMNHLAAVTNNEQAFDQVYNVAFGTRTQLLELIEVIRDALVKYDPQVANVKVIHTEPRPGDVRDSLADISKARNLLGYEPTHSLKEGIDEAMAWYWESLK
jgi:UDP-N-acetylglucosamine 4-epimerase